MLINVNRYCKMYLFSRFDVIYFDVFFFLGLKLFFCILYYLVKISMLFFCEYLYCYYGFLIKYEELMFMYNY